MVVKCKNDHSKIDETLKSDSTKLMIRQRNPDFEFIEPDNQGIVKTVIQEFTSPCKSGHDFLNSFLSFFPILQWLPKYSIRDNLFGDIIAGITVGVLHVPQGIAYALLAGIKPINGLYMSFFAPLFYMFFGTSMHCSLGSFAVVSLMTGVANENIMQKYYGINATDIFEMDDYSIYQINPMTIASTLAFTVGICELIIALLRLDFLCVYFSDPLVGGFTTGAAVHVFASQLDDIMGIKLTRVSGPGYLFVVIYQLALKVYQSNLWTLGISACAAVFLIVGKDYVTPAINKFTPVKIVIPYELIVMIISTIVSHTYSWHGIHSIQVVGTVPKGLPTPHLPQLHLIPECLPTALAITIVTIAVHISMAKMIAKRLNYSIDPSQEMYAVGFTSALSGLFPVFPCSIALARTMVTVECGAKTLLSNLLTASLLLSVIMWFGPYFESLPLCILSTVIVCALRPMFLKFKDLPQLWRISKLDYDLDYKLCSYRMHRCDRRPNWGAKITKPVLSENGITIRRTCIFKFESFLLFTNAERFEKAAYQVLNSWTGHLPRIREDDKAGFYFVFDCSALSQIDTMGINAIKDVISDIQSRTKAIIYYANARDELIDLLLYSKVAGSHCEFVSSVDEFLTLINLRPFQRTETNPNLVEDNFIK
uniref:STAS domain-containing protein n=1 Tax=Panagrolaimus davidi TaxID=227884 RepID=A0A914QAL3_9BILA